MKKTVQKGTNPADKKRKSPYDIIGYPLTRTTPIDKGILETYGFKLLEEKDFIGREIWAFKPPRYYYEIRFIKGNYPATNANCGIVMIYRAEEKDIYYDQQKNGKVKEKLFTFPEVNMTIAHYVNTAERLRTIILALTEENI